MRVLFLDLDTLRPDHLGCYGYHRNTSPNIDRVAAEGVTFDKYYCPDAPCLPSRAALVNGIFGIKSGAINHGGTNADLRLEKSQRRFHTALSDNSLWSIFRKAGMHTCSISPFAERHSSFWFLSGMNETHNHSGKCGMESAEEVTPVVMNWLENNGADDNWLLHINFWDPHTPYRAPEEFGNPFADEPLPPWMNEETLTKHGKLAGPHTARDNGMYSGTDDPNYPRHPNDIKDMQQLRRCIDGYDCGIKYMDDNIGMILQKLEQLGVLEDTAIIITSDHGENFGELGIYSEHGTADNITCRIPMIIRWPGAEKNIHDTGFHYNLDLLPTLCDLLEVDMPGREKFWDGQSYAQSLLKGEDTGRSELILSQCAHVCQRSVRWDKWLYMRTYHDGLHPHFADEMLFDLESDPHEQNNIAEDNEEIINIGARKLMQWHDRAMASQPFGYVSDPMREVLSEGGPEHSNRYAMTRQISDYMQRLRETDRADKIEQITRRHPWIAEIAQI